MLKFIPLKAQAGFTGFESPASEYVQQSLDLDKLVISHPTATYTGYAEGESMIDVGIYSGDLIIISRAEEIKNNDIIVANLNGVFVVKQVEKPNRRLLSAAKGYAAYTLNSADEFQIEGVVTRSIRLHRQLASLF
jgi:DNA polymerase V